MARRLANLLPVNYVNVKYLLQIVEGVTNLVGCFAPGSLCNAGKKISY